MLVVRLTIVGLSVGGLFVESHRGVSTLAATDKLDPEPADELTNQQTDNADGQTDKDTSHDRDEDGDDALEEGVRESVSVVRTVRAVVAVRTPVTRTGRTVWAHVRGHTALQLAVAVGIRSTKVGPDVAGHLVRRPALGTTAASKLSNTAVLGFLKLLVNGVQEAAERSWQRSALLGVRTVCLGAVRAVRAVRVEVRVWWRWRSKGHWEVVHHVLVGWFDGEDEEFAVLVSQELDSDLVDSHGLVVET